MRSETIPLVSNGLILEYSYIAIAIVQGKMLSITIHLSLTSSSAPNTPDGAEILNPDKMNDDQLLTMDTDIPLASLSSARCGFGVTSTNDAIYALGRISSAAFESGIGCFRWI